MGTARLPPPCRAIACAALMGAATIIPVRAFADDSARISRLETEIQLLRTQIDEQNRRIQRLEAELQRRAGAPAPLPQPGNRASGTRADPGAPTARLPWHAPGAWDRVARGMTAEEVKAILGEPTAVEALESFKTLFYRGTLPGGAILSGLVNMRGDRVVAVKKPAFQNAVLK